MSSPVHSKHFRRRNIHNGIDACHGLHSRIRAANRRAGTHPRAPRWAAQGANLSDAIEQLERQADVLLEQVFHRLTRGRRRCLAAPARPYPLDYIDAFTIGPSCTVTKPAMMTTHSLRTARLDTPVMVIGHQKGRNTKENIHRNFGMARPDGYRKALRLMELANRYGRPILTFIDTPGAYPGIDAEERGQAEAIARNIMEMSTYDVPIICTVIGEGGSGGAPPWAWKPRPH